MRMFWMVSPSMNCTSSSVTKRDCTERRVRATLHDLGRHAKSPRAPRKGTSVQFEKALHLCQNSKNCRGRRGSFARTANVVKTKGSTPTSTDTLTTQASAVKQVWLNWNKTNAGYSEYKRVQFDLCFFQLSLDGCVCGSHTLRHTKRLTGIRFVKESPSTE